MSIPVPVQAGAWTGWRAGSPPGDVEAERALTAVAEHALRCGARAGLDALAREALRLSGAVEVALYRGRVRVAACGTRARRLPATFRQMKTLQVFRAPDGRTSLVLRCERPVSSEDVGLEKLAAFAGTLMSAVAREGEAQARQAQLLRERKRLEETVAHLERQRRKAAHDLRTPLLVIQGYVGMMLKGVAGPLTPTMQRYAQQLMKASADQASLIERRLSTDGAPEDLRTLLCATFERPGRARRMSVNLDCKAQSVPVKGSRAVLDVLLRTLERGLVGTGATAADVSVDAPEGTGLWRLSLCAQTERPLPARTTALLEQLVLRLGGQMSIQLRPRLALTLHLPAAR